MKADPLPAAWNGSSTVERTVTLLGATGSIGASTVDLLKRERKRFRVEAVCANKSAAALAALARELGARFAAVDILPDPRIRQELTAISNWPTIPQLFVDGKLVGGCDIVTEMYESGELAQLL